MEEQKEKDLVSMEDWNERYVTDHTPWDLGSVAPPFVALMKEERFPSGKLLVPGCGRGYEAIYFARHGFAVTACDFSQQACAEMQAMADRAEVPLQVECGDFFNLPQRYAGAFDYMLEQTFFCAIPPEKRPDYVKAAAHLLKPGGRLFGVFFQFDDEHAGREGAEAEEGPPFGTSMDELRHLFRPMFRIDALEWCDSSHPRRTNEELWAEFVRLPAETSNE